jgi:hypothetical protein
MAKPNSIPVANRKSRRMRPATPTAISLILTSPNPYDIEDENTALKETTDCDAVGHRIERDLDGG